MSNISIISSIQFSIDEVNLVSINFIFQSATYMVVEKPTVQGSCFEHSLEFSIAAITPKNEALLCNLKKAKLITIKDVNGLNILLTKTTRFNFEIEKNVKGTAGGFIGYKVKVIQTTTS